MPEPLIIIGKIFLTMVVIGVIHDLIHVLSTREKKR